MGAMSIISPEDATPVLSIWRGTIKPQQANMKTILATVAEYRRIPVSLILSGTRSRDVAHARQQVMWECRQVLTADGKHRYSFPMIAALLTRPGDYQMDHTTVMHGCKRHEERIAAWGLFFNG